MTIVSRSFWSNRSRWPGVDLGESVIVTLFDHAQSRIKEAPLLFPEVRFGFANAKLGSFPR